MLSSNVILEMNRPPQKQQWMKQTLIQMMVYIFNCYNWI